MNNKSQIFLFEQFFLSDQSNLIINELSDQINEFYYSFIKSLAEDKKKKIIFKDDKNAHNGLDLFGSSEFFIYDTKSKKDISSLISTSEKKIIVTDYKNYKIYKNNCIAINSYQYENDIISVIKDYYKIDNKNLIEFCLRNPESTINEVMKYNTNPNNYNYFIEYIDNKNFILEIRKKIYEIKSKNINLKKIYEFNKKEALYKKLSFLTY